MSPEMKTLLIASGVLALVLGVVLLALLSRINDDAPPKLQDAEQDAPLGEQVDIRAMLSKYPD